MFDEKEDEQEDEEEFDAFISSAENAPVSQIASFLTQVRMFSKTMKLMKKDVPHELQKSYAMKAARLQDVLTVLTIRQQSAARDKAAGRDGDLDAKMPNAGGPALKGSS